MYIVCGFFLLAAFAFAADKPVTKAIKTGSVNTNAVKAAKMNARGKVIAISDESITIERAVRGNVEITQFDLDKRTENVFENDYVSIAYIEQDGKLIASRVSKVTNKTNAIKPAAEKSAPGKK